MDRGSQPLISLAGGILVASDSRGVAFVSSNGEIRHRADVGAPAVAPAVTPDDDLVLVTLGGQVLLLDFEGRVLRRSHTEQPVFSQLLVLGDGVAVWASGQGLLLGVDVTDFSIAFREIFPVGGTAYPVEYASEGLLVVTNTAGMLRRVPQPMTWMASSVTFRGPSAVANDGTLWGVADDGVVASVNPQSGAAVRARATTHTGVAPLLVSDGSMRILGAHEVTATDSRGNSIWTYQDATNRVVDGIVDNDGKTVIVEVTPAFTGVLACLDASGNLLWSTPFQDRPAEDPPTLTDDGVIALLAVNRQSGNTFEVLGFR